MLDVSQLSLGLLKVLWGPLNTKDTQGGLQTRAQSALDDLERIERIASRVFTAESGILRQGCLVSSGY